MPSKEIERAAANEWADLGADARRDAMQRAYQHCLRQAVENAPPTPAKKGKKGDGGGGGGGASANKVAREPKEPARRRRRRVPCEVCGECDDRDCVRCGGCDKASCHLMCVWPPLETEEGAEWRCLSCATPEALAEEHALPSVGEAIEVAGPADGEWRPATVRRAKGGRLVAGSADPAAAAPPAEGEAEGEEAAAAPEQLDEFGLSDEGTRWRRSAEVRARAAQRAAEADAAAAAHAAAAEKKAALLIGDAEALTSPVLPQVEELYREGLVEAGCAISAEQIEACTDVVSEAYANYMHAVKTLDLQEDLQLKGFMEIKMRHTGRYDLQLPELSTAPFSFLLKDAPWMGLVHAALGDDAVLTHFGCMLSFPGSTNQPWHQDGPHIAGSGGNAGSGGTAFGDGSFVAPLHAVNVFVPLIDITSQNGGTEFIAKTHLDYDHREASRTPLVKAGHALIFDYRTKHRGLGNQSSDERPLLYITCASGRASDAGRRTHARRPAAHVPLLPPLPQVLEAVLLRRVQLRQEALPEPAAGERQDDPRGARRQAGQALRARRRGRG